MARSTVPTVRTRAEEVETIRRALAYYMRAWQANDRARMRSSSASIPPGVFRHLDEVTDRFISRGASVHEATVAAYRHVDDLLARRSAKLTRAQKRRQYAAGGGFDESGWRRVL